MGILKPPLDGLDIVREVFNDVIKETLAAKNPKTRVKEGLRHVEENQRVLLSDLRRAEETKSNVVESIEMKKPQKITWRQRTAFAAMVHNGGTIKDAMISAGYAPKTADSPAKLTKSAGFRYLMRENGLNEKLVIVALRDDIEMKPGFRIRELALAAKMLGMVSPPQSNTNVNIIGSLPDPEKRKIIDIL